MGKTLSEVLAEGREGLSFSQFVGQTLTFLDVEVLTGQFKNDDGTAKTYGRISALDADGEEVVIKNGGAAFHQLVSIKENDLLPCELIVRQFPGQFGKPGWALDEVVEASS